MSWRGFFFSNFFFRRPVVPEVDEGNFASFGEALVRGFVHLCVNCLPDFFCFVLFAVGCQTQC